MSWKHSAWASSKTAGSAMNKLVLMIMADATSHDNPVLILKIKNLALKCEASESSVKRAIAELESRGLLACINRYCDNSQLSNAYILVHDDLFPGDLVKISKSSQMSGFNHVLKPFSWFNGYVESDMGVAHTEPTPGFTLNPPPGHSDLPNTTESFLPKTSKPITTPFASLTSAESSQQSENTAGEQSAAPTQTLASSQISSAQPQIEALATRPASKRQPAPTDSVAASIYALYPRKVARAAALKAIKKALVENPDIDMSEAVTEYAKATSTWKESDKTYIPYPASWFNGGCFLDDRNEWWKKSTTSPVISRGRRI